MKRVLIHSDGACEGNPGPGGWAAIVIDDGHERELTGGETSTTNQRMELRGAIEGLAAIQEPRRTVALYSDSAYVVNCFRDRWYVRWRQNGWATSWSGASTCASWIATRRSGRPSRC